MNIAEFSIKKSVITWTLTFVTLFLGYLAYQGLSRNDDFGDVYGVYYALTGEGFNYAELKKVAELLKRELLTVTNVKKIVFLGEQTEAVYVEMAKEKMTALGITREEIFNALSAKNLPTDAGKVQIGSEYISVYDTVTKAVNGFLVNLAEAVLIVIGVLLIFMGLRSGLIIGFILLLTIAGTFVLLSSKILTEENFTEFIAVC